MNTNVVSSCVDCVCVCVCACVCVCVCFSCGRAGVAICASWSTGTRGGRELGCQETPYEPWCVCACMYVSMYVFVCVVCVREKCVMSHDVRASAYVYRVCVLAYVCVSTCAFVCVSVCLCLCLSLSVSVPLSEQGT